MKFKLIRAPLKAIHLYMYQFSSCVFFFRHVGDLGNIMEGDDGSIMHSFTDHIIQLEGNYSIIGKSIVVSNCFVKRAILVSDQWF